MATDIGSDELNDTAGGEHNRLKTLGKYRIQKRIGAGGMGTVFLAVDDSLNRTVALKVLPKDRAENPVLVRRFKAEGQAAAHLEHPNIVRVFEAGEADGFLYMALEYIEGIDVHELVERRGVVPIKRSTDIIRQTALALQHAHDKGIVHRDIKPSNLLIKRDGSVKLADLGLARSIDDTLETNITRAGTTVGTVDYMAPEQARNSKAADVRSDIYSLGCTWYHMLTGHPPFPEGSMTNKLQAHAVGKRPDPRAENGRVPEGIVAVIQRMMAANPENRYQDPAALLEDLEATGKMHRGLDESVLAALADDAAEIEEAEEIHEPDLRQMVEIDAADLAALGESGEYVVEDSPPKKRKKPVSSRRKPNRTRPAKRETPVDAAVLEENESDKPAEFKKRQSGNRKAAPPVPPPTPVNRTGESLEEDTERPPEHKPKRTAPAKRRQEPSKYTSSRSTKRGTVTTAGGKAPALPQKMDALPTDGPAKKSLDLDTLKYVIPAVLVVGVLAAIVYAVVNSGDGGGSGGDNPYVDESSEQGSSRADGSRQPTEDEPKPDIGNEDPVPASPPQVSAIAFPGAEGAPLTTNGVPLIPDWVNSFRAPIRSAERSLIVRRRPLGDDEVDNLDEALRSLPESGGTIELADDGPYRLRPAHIESRGRVRIVAAEGRRPVVHMVPDEQWRKGAFLQLSKTWLDLRGVHFVFTGEAGEGAAAFGIREGNLSVHDCSLTSEGVPPTSISAFRVESQTENDESGKCLFENVLIRGEGVTAVELIGRSSELVAGNSLFVAGDAPAVKVVDRRTGSTSGSGSGTNSRGVRLLATTVLSANSAITFDGGGSPDPAARCAVVTRKSVLAASSGGAVTAVFHDWTTTSEERPAGLSWASEQSVFVGWTRLLSPPIPPEQSAAETDAWREFWTQPLTTGTVVAEALPRVAAVNAAPESVGNLLTTLLAPAADEELPGCQFAEFAPLPLGLIEHVLAVTHKPDVPDWLGEGMTVQEEPREFDLSSRRSLSRFLASDACPDGSHVIAHGSGLREIERTVISGKSLRLEFESRGETPLVLRPKAGREGSVPDESWITVRNGTLDLVNAPLKIPSSDNLVYPKSAILLADASLSLRNCVVEGPLLRTGAAPLVRWTGSQGRRQKRAILVENCFLVGLSSLLSGPVHWSSVDLRNSVLACRSDAIVIEAESPEQLPATVALDHCTISSGGAAIRVDVPPALADSGALTLFCRASVFAGPDAGATDDVSSVVAHPAGAAASGSVIWWGSANGYSSARLSGYRVEGSGFPGSFQKSWLSGWGDGHEANPLTGPTDVLFAKDVPNVKLIRSDSFALSDSTTAATWGPMREPIGASAETIGPRRKSAGTDSTAPKGGSPAGTRTRKNDLGF